MVNHDPVDPVILDAVRAHLRDAEQAVAALEQDVGFRLENLRKAEFARDQALLRRDKFAEYLNKHAASIEPQPLPQPEPPSVEQEQPRVMSRLSPRHALALVSALLADGKHLKVPEIVRALDERGVQIVAHDPIRRLTQTMSASRQFEADRTLGWRLKKQDALPSEGAAQ